ncbi:hypothetical protein BDZ45DRAFT_748561 [Acephala macrosclerotiorum]|nr:hypothetical protein BDZ45DRAFT_748561 [Acephala macrosclerotiorum]
MSRESSVSIRYYDSAEDDYPADQFPDDEVPEIEFVDDEGENPFLDSLEKELNKYSSGNSSFSGVAGKSEPKRDYWAELKQLEKEMARKKKHATEDELKIQQAQRVTMKASIVADSKSTYDMVDGVEYPEVLLKKQKEKLKQRSKLEARQEKNFDAMLDRFEEAADAKKSKQEAGEARGKPIPVVSLSREGSKKGTIPSGVGVPGAPTGPKSTVNDNISLRPETLAVAPFAGSSGVVLPGPPRGPKKLVNGTKPSQPDDQDTSGKILCSHETCPRSCGKGFKSKAALSDHLRTQHPKPILHPPQFSCPHSQCKKSSTKPFDSQEDLNNHLRHKHPSRVYCPHQNCKRRARKPFRIQEDLDDHLQRSHPDVGNSQRGGKEGKKDKNISTMAVEEELLDPSGGLTVGYNAHFHRHPIPKAASLPRQSEETNYVDDDKLAGWDKFSIAIKGEDPPESKQHGKKRKRAISNAESVPLRQTPDVRSDSTEPPKKKSKNNKKEEKQNPVNTGYGQLSYREVQNLIKEQHGKTASKKRQRKLDQQAQASALSTENAIVIEDSEPETIRAKKKKHKEECQSQESSQFPHPARNVIIIDAPDIKHEMAPPKKKRKEKRQTQELSQQTEVSAQSTQESALRLNEVPEYVSKAEALRRTITRNRAPSTPPEVIAAASQRPLSHSPALALGYSIKTPEKSFISLGSETPVHPPSGPLTPVRQRARSASASTSRGTKGKGKANLKASEVETTRRDLLQAVDSIKKVFATDKLQVLFSSDAFSPSPTEGTTPRASTSVVKQQPSSKGKKRKADEITQDSMVSSDWEEKGKVRARVTSGDKNDDAEVMENVAFSASYISKKNSIRVSHTAFSIHHLEAGEKIVLGGSPEEGGRFMLRICTIAEGRVRVLLGKHDKTAEEAIFFEIGKGGMFRVKVGEKCEVCAVEVDEVKVRSGGMAATIFIVGVE